MNKEQAFQYLMDHDCEIGEYPNEIEGIFVILPAY